MVFVFSFSGFRGGRGVSSSDGTVGAAAGFWGGGLSVRRHAGGNGDNKHELGWGDMALESLESLEPGIKAGVVDMRRGEEDDGTPR